MPIGIFAHEIQHILHNDVVARLCVNLSPYYLKKNESGKFFYEFIDMKAHKAFQKKYCKFTEKRADLMAGLVAPECALGLAKFHAKSNHILMRTALWLDSTWLGQLFEEDPCPEHPIPSERAAYMTRLHTEMLAAIVKK